MAIVPSGTRRLMKMQQSSTLLDADPEATQEQYSIDGNQGSTVDWGRLQENAQGVAGDVPSQEDLEGAVGDGLQFPGQSPEVGVSEGGDGLGVQGTNIRDAVFQLLTKLGIPERMLSGNPDAFFQGKKDLTNNTLTGMFMLPSYVQQRKIGQEEAEQIALKIGQQFGLQLTLSHKGNNFQVDFRTQDMAPETTGTSFDELALKGNNKSAQTQGEMIKQGRSELIDKLLSIGRGE